MKIVNVDPSKLIPAEYNPRTLNSKQRRDITASLEEVGFVDPVIVNQHPDRKNIIVGGHQRVKVAQEIGYDEVPVFYVNLELEKEKELNVRLNKNTGDWDFDALEEFFEVDDLMEWGFEDCELDFYKVSEVNSSDENAEWIGMPEFEEKEDNLKIIIQFENEFLRDEFLKKYPIDIMRKQSKAWSTKWPYDGMEDPSSVKFEQEESEEEDE